MLISLSRKIDPIQYITMQAQTPTVQWTLTSYSQGYATPTIYVCRRTYSAFGGKITLEIALKLDRTGHTIELSEHNRITGEKILLADEEIIFQEDRTIDWENAIQWAEGMLHNPTEVPDPASPPSYETSLRDVSE
jgi:hypothetical protein